MKFKPILEPAKEGGYTVYVPSLPGCISEGDTKELYLEPEEHSLKKTGIEINLFKSNELTFLIIFFLGFFT